MAKTSNGGWEMSIRKRTLLLVPVLLVLACATFAIGGNVVDYTYDADGNTKDAITSSGTSVHITATPVSILPGGTATLAWTSINANSCSIDQGIGTVPLSGSMSVTSRPSIRILPDWIFLRPQRHSRKIVLPEPGGPRRMKYSPSAMSMLRRRSSNVPIPKEISLA